MRQTSPVLILLVVLCVGVLACSPSTGGRSEPPHLPSPTASADILNYLTFLVHLRAKGTTVVEQGAVMQPFLSVDGKILAVNGERVEVHEYASPQDLQTETAIIESDGVHIGTYRVDWVAPPHLYRAGRLLVIYTGNQRAMLDILVALLGPQFAGQ